MGSAPEDGPLSTSRHIKRLVDITLALTGLVATAPAWFAIPLAIKWEDRGPVFYGQDRAGLDGRRFRSWKFRSMIVRSDLDFGPLQASEGDSRVTRVGRVLRATALDELPQLWNILKGDMSFVGPRALMPEEIEVSGNGTRLPIESVDGYTARHRVPPGLTGFAQVYLPRDAPRRVKFKYDLLYIRTQSLGFDLKLILLSIWISIRAKWESRSAKL